MAFRGVVDQVVEDPASDPMLGPKVRRGYRAAVVARDVPSRPRELPGGAEHVLGGTIGREAVHGDRTVRRGKGLRAALVVENDRTVPVEDDGSRSPRTEARVATGENPVAADAIADIEPDFARVHAVHLDEAPFASVRRGAAAEDPLVAEPGEEDVGIQV